tara:strand:- start:4926 stop:6287 length:1362 start_codon:yes stop_codon:yes gene_type:complete
MNGVPSSVDALLIEHNLFHRNRKWDSTENMTKSILSKAFASNLKKGRLRIAFADGEVRDFGTPTKGFPEISLRFTDTRVPWDIIMDSDLGMGEAYMNGRMIVEQGDILDFCTLLRANARYEDSGKKLSLSLPRRLANKAMFELKQFNNRVRSQKNAAHHYDIGNELYQLMLDHEHLQYSCAYWPQDNMTLGEAQEAKLIHIASKLGLADGQTVLDVGCGWGGMAIFLAKHFDVQVTAITLSVEQVDLARERAEAAGVSGRVTFELVDYRELARQDRRFDRIVSVGMLEHVGQPQFDRFFQSCAELLKSDGVMLLHTIGRMGPPGLTDVFTSKYIFPGGYIPALSETMEASEKSGLIASDVEMLRVHYAKTIRCWYENCVVNREAIVDMYDERFFRMWTLYLAGAATMFEHGGMYNLQIQYTADRNALPLTRSYMHATEDTLKRSSKPIMFEDV